MEKEFNLTKEKKEALEKAKKFKENINCSDCSEKEYMICNVQFTKEEYKAWKKNLI